MKELTQSQIGKIIKNGHRDAVHVAVIPVVADTDYFPGQHIGYKDGFTTKENPLGIVDPFLKEDVKQGQMFYMFLYPNTITSLSHLWTHPEIAEEVSASKEASEQWLRNFIENADCPGYEEVIAKAVNNDEEWLHFDGSDAHGEIPAEFWTHIEIVTGKKIPQENRATSFSCSC